MSFRTDLAETNNLKFKHLYYRSNKQIEVSNLSKNNYDYRLIKFNDLIKKEPLKKVLKQELDFFFKKILKSKNFHILIVGLGNENLTADSIGPKTLKHIQVNSHLESLVLEINYPKVSALEPGVLGTTGIDTFKTIKSVVKEIKPDIVLLIDSYICDDHNYLNSTIQITDDSILPGSGIKGANSEINKKNLSIPIIAIGVPTAMEYINNTPFLVSKSDLDQYVLLISQIIGEAINEILQQL